MLKFREFLHETVSGDILKQFKGLDPDFIYKGGAITFIFDRINNKLYDEEYPTAHYDLAHKYRLPTVRFRYHEIDDPFIMGRLGHYEVANKQYPIIGFWNHEYHYEDIEHVLHILSRKFPEFFTDDTVIIGDYNSGVPVSNLTDWGIQPQSINYSPEEQEYCQLTVDINGKPTKLTDILGQLHMVRGQNLATLQGSFCAQYPYLIKNQPEVCTKLLYPIADKLKCGQSDYNKYLKSGKADYTQRLRDIFRDPARINKEFSTQKDIDAAWDYLQRS